MRASSVILFLIACSANLAAGGFAKKVTAEKKIASKIIAPERPGSSGFVRSTMPGKPIATGFILSEDVLGKILQERKTTRFLLGKSKQSRKIEAWFFPGTSDKRAVVIGGVHGTELSSTEVARTLINNLSRGTQPYYNVIVIPCLFPDNASQAILNAREIGSTANIGRYSFAAAPDPNRQMPAPGRPFNEEQPKDHFGREIEKENQFLLRLISIFKPDRIANVHAIRDLGHAGIYADPRTDDESIALGYETDSSLAVDMASLVYRNGGFIPGNCVDTKPTALYYKDPAPVAAGNFQKRNFSGSLLPSNRGSGITLGTWASTAIADAKDPSQNRDAMRILTIEFPGYKRPVDYGNPRQQEWTNMQVALYASAIERIFLGEYYVERPIQQGFAVAKQKN